MSLIQAHNQILQYQHFKSRAEQLNYQQFDQSLASSCWGRFLHLGVLTQRTPGLQVSLSLHLNGNGVEIVGRETSLCHFSQHSLSIR